MRFDIITIFPELFGSVFSAGIIRKAIEKGLIEVQVHDLRDYASGKHQQVDDRPFGGDAGMVLKPEPIFRAVEAVREDADVPVVLMSPQGRRLDSPLVEKMARSPRQILICGRYDGVDERVVQGLVTDEISIGDYVLSGGELAALVLMDSVARFVPGVVGKAESVEHDSFFRGSLDYPQYTRPREFRGMAVPDILFSGDHAKITEWRRRAALEKTWSRRPDLLDSSRISPDDRNRLEEIKGSKEGRKNGHDQ